MQRFARGLARAMLAFCLCGVAFGALAQGPGTPPLAPAPVAGEAAPALSITRVDLGFGGALVPERWQPVVVWLFSERAIEGVVSLEYLQDGSQRARVEVAFATTPGRAIPVELACAPPQRLDRLTLRVRGGPRELRRVYAEFPGENEEQFTLRSGGELIALSLGDTAVEEAIGAWSNVTVNQLEIPGAVPPRPPMYVDRGSSTAPALDAAAQWRQRVRAMKVDPAGAPLAWLAYDAASVVIVRAVTLGSMDVRRRSALMTWVESGGRLIVLMDPGTAWTNAAAFPGAPLPVEAGEIRALEPIDSQVAADGDSAAFGVLDARLRPREIAGRAMVLTPQGMRDGWRLGWRVTPRSGERGAGGLLATGPVGMGIVTLLGIEPRLVPVMLDGSATGRLWEQVLVGDEVGILPQFKRPSAGFDADQMQWWYRGSGEDVAGADGIAAALDMTARGLAVPDGVFVLVGLSMVALALLVGPGDFFLLRRRGLGGRTWIAAIGWTGLATAGAYFLPGLLQTSGS